jgi:hypothetical protein
MLNQQLTHLTGPDHDNLGFRNIREKLHRQLNRNSRNAHPAARYRSVSMDFLTNRKRAMKKTIQNLTSRLRRNSQPITLLHLTYYLTLTDNHTVKARTNRQQMPDRILALMPIKILAKRSDLDPMKLTEKLLD